MRYDGANNAHMEFPMTVAPFFGSFTSGLSAVQFSKDGPSRLERAEASAIGARLRMLSYDASKMQS